MKNDFSDSWVRTIFNFLRKGLFKLLCRILRSYSSYYVTLTILNKARCLFLLQIGIPCHIDFHGRADIFWMETEKEEIVVRGRKEAGEVWENRREMQLELGYTINKYIKRKLNLLCALIIDSSCHILLCQILVPQESSSQNQSSCPFTCRSLNILSSKGENQSCLPHIKC